MSNAHLALGSGIVEPDQWIYVVGDKSRKPVIDHNFHPPRVVRYVGWRRCLCCPVMFFSPDVVRVRLCYLCRQESGDAVFHFHSASP